MNKPEAESKMIRVIQTVYLKGHGSAGDPMRRATVYFHTDGRLIAEEDPGGQQPTIEQAVAIERERCAKIAETFCKDPEFCPEGPEGCRSKRTALKIREAQP